MMSPRVSTLRVSLNTLFWLGLIAFCCAPQAARAFPQRLGDLDEDTAPTVLDIVRVVNHFTGATRLSPSLEPFADVDQDGAVNETDAAVVAKAILGVHPLPNVPLARVRETSPAHGEGSVAVTRETIFRLNFPLATNAVVSNTNLWAQFGGRRILSRVELSPDRRTLTLFYLEPLPAAARIRVTLNGSGVNDFLGRPIDADGDGIAGGSLIVDFDTLNLAVVAGTVVSGRVFASELAQGASPEQSVNIPLAGVTITVDGQEQTMRAVTDQFGNFRLDPAPAGEFFVHVDGRTASNYNPTNAYYPFVGKKWQSIAGEEVSIGNIYLPLIAEGSLVAVSPTNNTVITFPDSVLAEHPELQGVTVTIPPNSLYSDGGVRGGRVGIAPVAPDRLPEPLPPGLEFPLVITVQTDGPSNFDRPVPVCFPNLPDPRTGQVKPPGAKSGLWSFNHDVGRWEVVGSMTVSADGRFVCSDPGVGILQPGWHGEADGTSGSGGSTRTRGSKSRKRMRATAKQEATQNDCDSCSVCAFGCHVLLHSGEEHFSRVDLSIPGRGDIHFEMRRWYRSRLDHDGPLGHGWDFSYNQGLFIEPNGDVVRNDGRGHLDTWTRNPDGSFAAPAGHFRDLVERPDGTLVLREANGFQRFYRRDGRLFSYEDRFGNIMLFDYDASGNLKTIVDPFGREISFVFESFTDGVDRLVRVRDFAAREVVYSYDAKGDLVAVRTPTVTGTSTGNDFPEGRTERYTYSSGFAHPELNHNLLSVTLPQEVATGGPAAFSWTFGTNVNDPVTFDRVLTETVGGTNASGIPAGGTTVFTYAELNADVPLGNPDVPRSRTHIVEPNGNVREYFMNERQHQIIARQFTRGLRPGEPPYYETKSFFNEDGLPVREVLPESNEVRYAYASGGDRGQQQNLIELRHVAGPRGGGEDLVTTFTYEPLYNRVASKTEPRGNATGFTPPIGSFSRERYTTRYFYDYQESADPVPHAISFAIDLSTVPRNLGDLNGDGRTDRHYGNLVRIQAPTVQLRSDALEALRLGDTTQEIITELQWNDRGQLSATIDAEGNVTELRYHREDDPDGDGATELHPYMYVSSAAVGYLRAEIVDSRNSPRRRTGTSPLGLESTYRYDRIGNIVAVRNGRGIVTEIEVNPLREVVAITRGADVSQAIASGQLLEQESPRRYQMRFHYDFNGRLIRTETDNRDSTMPEIGAFVDRSFTYDILNNLVERRVEVDARTILRWTTRYNPSGLPVLQVRPEGDQVMTSYDERNRPFRTTRGFNSPAAATTQIDYDGNGNVIRVLDAEDNDGNGQPETTLFTYDGFDRLTATTDALGNRTVSLYDVAGNRTRRQLFGHPPAQPSSPSVLLSDVQFKHDELNRAFQTDEALFLSQGFSAARAIQLRDENMDGFVTTLREFDALSRLTVLIEDDGEISKSTYDGAGRVVEAADHLGNSRFIMYDRNSNPVRVQSVEVSPERLVPAQTFTTHYVYDQLDRVIRITDNAGQTTRFGYDSRNNLIARSDAQGAPLQDPLGLFPGAGQSGMINSAGNTKGYVYDGLDRRIREVYDLRVGGLGGGFLDISNPFNPDGQIALSYAFDGNSRLIAITDDNNNTTRFEYDALDRRVRQVNADQKTFTFVYDRDSNLRQVTDANGSVINRTFDALNRLIRAEVLRAPGVVGTTVETFQYDGWSRLVRSTDDNGGTITTQTREYVYDSLSRILEEKQNGQPISSVWAGDGKRISCTYSGGRTITHTFDSIDRVKRISDAAGPIAESTWIGPGQRELTRARGNGTQLSFLNDARDQAVGYDALNRPIRVRDFLPGGNAVVDREYGYNRTSQRTFERRHDDAGVADHYNYDSVHRLVRTDFDQAGVAGAPRRPTAQINYAYDGVGNRRVVQALGTNSTAISDSYAVNVMNEYTAISGLPQTHDENGNLIDDGSRTLAYDYKNRLVRVADKLTGRPIAEYFYLADNRRSRKRVFSQTNPGVLQAETIFTYDGWRVCEEQSGNGSTMASFAYGPIYIDQIIQMERTAAHPLGAGEFYLHQNARADVVAITDATGQMVEKTTYDDFGTPSQVSAIGNPYLFQGARFDAETGLYYFRNRYYDPLTGRFLQRDPIWDPNNLGNQYAFVGNRPISSVDPMGLGDHVGDYSDMLPPLVSDLQSLGLPSQWLQDLINKHGTGEVDKGPSGETGEFDPAATWYNEPAALKDDEVTFPADAFETDAEGSQRLKRLRDMKPEIGAIVIEELFHAWMWRVQHGYDDFGCAGLGDEEALSDYIYTLVKNFLIFYGKSQADIRRAYWPAPVVDPKTGKVMSTPKGPIEDAQSAGSPYADKPGSAAPHVPKLRTFMDFEVIPPSAEWLQQERDEQKRREQAAKCPPELSVDHMTRLQAEYERKLFIQRGARRNADVRRHPGD